MGLDTSHNCWHGAYSHFNLFRRAICQAAGFGVLDNYEGFSGSDSWPAKAKSDAIIKLLNHSDCEGEIAADDCGPIADRLSELLPLMGEWKPEAEKFIAGLRDAAANHENVTFS